ncbi:ABC transporter substrate-binding protein [Sciscionella sediminilitoris]|uniref:ABC transporter substrate-binding protein n=1 Tax=Sciscionella sediminilitoris TaxID=1445613 RepID=UPI0004DFC8F1|nr:ABC transporter substrate-binding protein [Sciscionella sp. SE31]
MRIARITATACAGLLLAGCGATIESAAPSSPAAPVTITNCGEQTTFERTPRRVVTNDIGITEIMFALGLRDRLAGYTMNEDARGLETSPWRADFAKTRKLGKKLNTETAQGVNADLVFAGWSYGFSQASGVTPETLAKQGIKSYLLTESCRNGSHRGIMPPLQALYTDIRNLGRLFKVTDRANRLIAGYQQKVAKAQARIPKNRPKVFLYDSGTDAPTSAGRYAAANEIIEKAGGRNIFADSPDTWVRYQWEPVAERQPDVVLINDYDSGQQHTAEDKRRFLLGYPTIAAVPAIKNKRFFALPYAALVESPRNPDAIAAFADYLHRQFP